MHIHAIFPRVFIATHFSARTPPTRSPSQNSAPHNISINPFRINTSASVHSNQLKLPWNQRLQKTGGRGPVIVNQISDEEIWPDDRSEEEPLCKRDEACLSRATIGSTGLSQSLPRYVITSFSRPRRKGCYWLKGSQQDCFASPALRVSIVGAAVRNRACGIPNHQLRIHLLLHGIPLALFEPGLDSFHHDIDSIRSHGLERLAHGCQ